jgi:hypothetical protein
MCSQPLRRKMPMLEEHAGALQQALLDVAQESYFSFAEPCDQERFSDALLADDGSGPARWLGASVDFDGAFAGRVELKLPYALASELLSAFVGLMPDEEVPEGHVLDSTGEFANMVCGTWLTRDCGRRRFDLQAPVVCDIAVPAKSDEADQLVLVNNHPVSLRLEFKEAA